jgi:hypothetical protein
MWFLRSSILKLIGKSYLDKVKELRETLANKKSSGFVVSALDEIACNV